MAVPEGHRVEGVLENAYTMTFPVKKWPAQLYLWDRMWTDYPFQNDRMNRDLGYYLGIEVYYGDELVYHNEESTYKRQVNEFDTDSWNSEHNNFRKVNYDIQLVDPKTGQVKVTRDSYLPDWFWYFFPEPY